VHDRLSRLDRSFLAYETPSTHMHIAGASTFEAGGLRRPDGAIDVPRIRDYVASRLGRIPRYRQVVSRTPLGVPVWVDDPHFQIEYHVRHTSLPPPGDERQMKALCGRVFSQALDRARPLWELWVVDRVAGGERFGVIHKVHHAMVDGVRSVDLLETILTPEPITDFEPAPRWAAKPAPSTLRLALDEVGQLARKPIDLARRAPALVADARLPDGDIRAALRGLGSLASKTLRRPSETPLNKRIGPHRRFDWTATRLDDAQAVRRSLGGSVNDVVLATVAGAVRRFLERRGVSPSGVTFRVMAPVSIAGRSGRPDALGNHVGAWMVPLPIAEGDARARLAFIQRTTRRFKEDRSALGVRLFAELTGWTPAALLSLGARISWRNLPFNMVVTNVPGPQQPLHLLSARMLDYYGLVPLTDYLGLGVVVFSYAGTLYWGLNADWDVVPDVDLFARDVEGSFAELRDLA